MSEHTLLDAISVHPLGAALGAEVRGIDLNQPLSDEQVQAVREAWAEHLVLRFRGHALMQALEAKNLNGVIDLTPGIRSLQVHYQPETLSLANLLGQAGLSVDIYDREREVHALPRAVHFDGEVMRIFQSAGLAPAIAAASRASSKGMHFVNATGVTLMVRRGLEGPGPQGWAGNWYFHQPILEQILRAGPCGAVLAWPGRLGQVELKRFQLAAEAGKTTALMFREPAAAAEFSPAALRLKLAARPGGLRVDIFKCRGGTPAAVDVLLPQVA